MTIAAKTRMKQPAGATIAAALMLIAAATLAIVSIIHFGVVVPLGIVTVNDPFEGARIPEAIIAGVVAVGAISILAGWRGAWWLAVGSTLFALAGVLVGVRFVLFGGTVTRPGDLIYHAALFAMLLATLAVLALPETRRALRIS